MQETMVLIMEGAILLLANLITMAVVMTITVIIAIVTEETTTGAKKAAVVTKNKNNTNIIKCRFVLNRHFSFLPMTIISNVINSYSYLT
jgi:hypothetical protein